MKSQLVQFLLVIIFGSFGLLYSSALAFVFSLILSGVLLLLFGFFAIIPLVILNIIMGISAVSTNNSKWNRR